MDALLQKGGVAGHALSTTPALTRASAALGAFSTPIKATLPKVLANQLIEVVCFGYMEATIESGPVNGIELALVAGGNLIGAFTNETILAANTWRFFSTKEGGLSSPGGSATPTTPVGRHPVAQACHYVAPETAANVAVELQGACKSSGTISVEHVYLAARVWG